jgi:hypothetical protein
MATIETRQFGSTKKLLVIVTQEEAELVRAVLGKEFTQIRGEVRIADGCYETYLDLQKGVRDVNEQLGAELKAVAAWHSAHTGSSSPEETKMHKRWAKLLEKAAEKA